MRIKAKILWALLGMSLLVALVGGRAIQRQRAIGILEASSEAEEDARVFAFIIATDRDPAHAISEKISRYVYVTQGRDVEVVDIHKRVIADAIPAEVGMDSDHAGAELDQTLRDGRIRTFFETSPGHPSGMRLIVVPVKTESGQVQGAVIEEYTPIYNEFMAITGETTLEVVLAALAGVVLAVLLSLYIGTSIGRPLRQLTRAAVGFAAGDSSQPMPPPRNDEIGDLTVAFNVMMERRELAEKQTRKMADDLARERERLADILDSVPAMVFENWSIKETKKNFVNSYVETMYGYTPQEWLSTPDFWTGSLHPEDRQRVMETAARHFASGGAGGGVQVSRWLTKDNRVIWGETHIKVVHDAEGAVGVRGFTLDITEQKLAEQKLEAIHQRLIETSREAGKAEVASNVLHNVGNVLNSVNVSAALAASQLRESSAPHLGRVAELLRKNADNLGAYLTDDPMGRKLPAFVSQLAGQLEAEHATVLGELDQLTKYVEHIKDIVSVQQSYASAAGVSQTVAVVDMVEDSLRMNTGALTRHEVKVARKFVVRPVLCLDKHKVIQILVNLIRNAKYACDESNRSDKLLTVRVTADERLVRISVIDNGVGIPAENMTRIFSHGFTTRETGHGFGLHSSALAAQEMGGALLAESAGPGLGATFTLELPIESSLPS
jgi:PAS domain S-box-containing protein